MSMWGVKRSIPGLAAGRAVAVMFSCAAPPVPRACCTCAQTSTRTTTKHSSTRSPNFPSLNRTRTLNGLRVCCFSFEFNTMWPIVSLPVQARGPIRASPSVSSLVCLQWYIITNTIQKRLSWSWGPLAELFQQHQWDMEASSLVPMSAIRGKFIYGPLPNDIEFDIDGEPANCMSVNRIPDHSIL